MSPESAFFSSSSRSMRSMYFRSTSAATGPAFALVLCSIGPVPSAMVRVLRCDCLGREASGTRGGGNAEFAARYPPPVNSGDDAASRLRNEILRGEIVHEMRCAVIAQHAARIAIG